MRHRWAAIAKGSLLAFVAVALHAQKTDPQALLDEVRLKVASTVQRASRYTCMETIEPYWYANRKPVRPGCDTDRSPEINGQNLVRSDRLRLDVAVGSGQEMFSWHGQKSFQTEEIDRLVTAGPISSGTYFSFLSSVFLEGLATVDFLDLRSEAGKQLAAFGYSVPISESCEFRASIRRRPGRVIRLRGELAADILDDHGMVVAPKGTPVHGRLLRLETWVRPSHFYTVALQFRQLSFAGEDYKLNLRSIMEPLSVHVGKNSIRRRIQLNNPPISDDPAACRFRLNDKQVNLKGVTTFWVTN